MIYGPTAAICETILCRLADGESLRAICRDPAMPSRQTVANWLDASPELAARYAKARGLQADLLLDEMADIEAQTLRGTVEATAARAVLTSMQWRAAKLAPKKYGEKLELGGELVHRVARIERAIVRADPAD